MRFVPARILQEGMVLGRSLYDHSHNVLLSKGHELTEANITRIVELGYQGVYVVINEATLDMEEVKDIVTDELRKRAVQAVTSTFVTDEYDEIRDELTEIINGIINQLMDNKPLIINLYDLKTYDNYTFEHSVNVAILAIGIGIRYGLSREKLFDLGFGAIMHDIGKKMIDIEVLNKKTKLTADEMLEIRNHSSLGAELLKSMFKVNQHVVNCALQHHERYDGGGYPFGLVGEEISLNGRIIAVCDVYDALTSNRVYREAIEPHKAIAYIMQHSDTHFDAKLVELFVDNVAPYPIGTMVKLNNGLKGIVVHVRPRNSFRPVIKVLGDNENKIVRQPYDFNLNHPDHSRVHIVEVVSN